MKKIIIQFIIMFTIIIILFYINDRLKKDIYETSIYFVKNILPSLYPIMFISLYLKHNVLNKYNNKISCFLLSIITFSPSNALLTNSENMIVSSSIINPFYSYFIIKNILNKVLALKIVLTNIIINITITFTIIIKTNNNQNLNNKIIITNLIKNVTENIINIYGITIFFCIVKNVLLFINIPKHLIILIDVINGFKLINEINTFKVPLLIFLNSFTGLSMIFQIKSINKNITNKVFVKKFILSIIITLITMFMIKL